MSTFYKFYHLKWVTLHYQILIFRQEQKSRLCGLRFQDHAELRFIFWKIHSFLSKLIKQNLKKILSIIYVFIWLKLKSYRLICQNIAEIWQSLNFSRLLAENKLFFKSRFKMFNLSWIKYQDLKMLSVHRLQAAFYSRARVNPRQMLITRSVKITRQRS